MTRKLPENFHIVEENTHLGYVYFIAEGPFSRNRPEIEYKQYNGYVALPDSHPLDPIPNNIWDDDRYGCLDVHGGITYAEDGIIGFDTAHLGDYAPWLYPEDYLIPPARRWYLHNVREELFHLVDQLRNLEKEVN